MSLETNTYDAREGFKFKHIVNPTEKEWLEARKSRVNGTEVAALINQSPYCTPFELWHQKIGNVSGAVDIGWRGEVGKALEPVIAKLVSKKLGVKLRKVNGYFYNDDGMGATCDYQVTEGSLTVNDEEGHPKRVDGKGWLVEIKNVDYLVFRDNWLQRSAGVKYVEPPVHIELQGQQQCEVLGRPGIIFAPLVGGNDLQLVIRPADIDVGLGLRELTLQFWESQSAKQEPEVDFARDAEVLEILYSNADRSLVYKGTDAEIDRLTVLCEQYATASEIYKNAEVAKKAVKGEVLSILGDCYTAPIEGFSCVTPVVADSPGKLITKEDVGKFTGGRKGGRQIRITRKKAPAGVEGKGGEVDPAKPDTSPAKKAKASKKAAPKKKAPAKKKATRKKAASRKKAEVHQEDVHG